jgi:hypothetical protein
MVALPITATLIEAAAWRPSEAYMRVRLKIALGVCVLTIGGGAVVLAQQNAPAQRISTAANAF